jgi:hypothetical protein
MMIKTNPDVKMFLLVLFVFFAFFLIYNLKSDVEKCADNKLRNGFQGHTASEEWLDQSLKEKFKLSKYEAIFELCELEKKKTPETFKNKYK